MEIKRKIKNSFKVCLIFGGASGKESACQCRKCKEHRFDPWVGKTSWRRPWQPTPVFLLENPMDRGAWRATVRGVTKSQTRLRNFHFLKKVILKKKYLLFLAYFVLSFISKMASVTCSLSLKG